ncbi:hypothetical protein E4P39_01820 [Blastococcus sp. CT_GayMR19]|uniref:hypothetical protein n=1 Tax=Blastococcus sp. CT_GayMR19 TaxID=2559608 RepID=UPI0010742094|nr:hypothetical protein [Blastococcus sp. CT_GayMR19]TFV79401.1 hypothetical protein E4P39_01820 [Blastococcus sp. CT_GayMR19]
MKISPSRQRNAVSEGMALGLLLCDRSMLPFEKWRVDLAFEGAWRGWAYRERFSQVNTDIRNGLDGVWAMTRATQNKQTFNLYWDTSGAEVAVYARPQWAGEEIDEDVIAESIDGGVPASGWQALAEDFLVRFTR